MCVRSETSKDKALQPAVYAVFKPQSTGLKRDFDFLRKKGRVSSANGVPQLVFSILRVDDGMLLGYLRITD